MTKALVFPSSSIRESFRFKNIPVMATSIEGTPYKYPTIVLYDEITDIPVSYTGLERFIISTNITKCVSDVTLNKKAICVIEFLNFLLKKTNITSFENITRNTIADFLVFLKKEKRVKTDYWLDVRNNTLLFLKEIIEKSNHSFLLNKDDLIREILIRNEYGRKEQIKDYTSFGVQVPKRTSTKNRYLPHDFLEPLLFILSIYSPSLVLAVYLQAFGGLREGEVVNLSCGSITIEKKDFDSKTIVFIDLNQDASFFSTRIRKTNPGKIKKKRTQAIYYDFSERFEKQYYKHLDWLKDQGFSTSKESPLFVNKKGSPLTVSYYTQIVRNIFENNFLTYMEREFKRMGRYAEIAAYIDAYRSDYPGAHMFRHWFTMYLLTVKKESREAVMKYRGDSNINSMDTYVHINAFLLEEYKKSAYSFQQLLTQARLDNRETNE